MSTEFVLPDFASQTGDQPVPTPDETVTPTVPTGGYFSSTISKIILFATIIVSVVVVYLYIYKKPKTPGIEEDTEHGNLLSKTSTEELENMLVSKDTTPTPTPTPTISPQMEKAKQGLMNDFSYLNSIDTNFFLSLDPASAQCILHGKETYEKMCKNNDFFPTQCQILSLVYTKKYVSTPTPTPTPTPAPASATPEPEPEPEPLESILINNENEPDKSTTTTQKVTFNLDNNDSDEE